MSREPDHHQSQGPSVPKIGIWLPVVLIVLALAWLAMVFLPPIRSAWPFWMPSLILLSGALLGVGTAQFMTGRQCRRSVTRKLVLLNGASAAGIPLGVLLHNLISAVSGGQIEESAFFLLSVIVLPIVVIATSILVVIGASRAA